MNEDFSEFEIPKKKKERHTDPKLGILMLQLTACLILASAALGIKYFGGDFYSEVRTRYIEMFEDTTDIEEVLAAVRQPGGASSAVPPDTSSDYVADEAAPPSDEPVSSTAPVSSAAEETPLAGMPANTAVFNFDRVNRYSALSLSNLNSLYTPAAGPVSSEYGYRINPVTGIYALHSGIDIAADYGSVCGAALDGVVTEVGESSSYGIYIVLKHVGNVETLYAHLSSAVVQKGNNVKRGETIGLVGSTGNSTGPHLHFEVRVDGKRLNPRYLLSGLKSQ